MEIVKQTISKVDRYIDASLNYLPFAKMHLSSKSNRYVTKVLVIISLVLITYEVIFTLGLKFKLWEDPAKQFFKEKPPHCAHVYATVVFIKSNNSIEDLSDYDLILEKGESLLKTPLKYHIEFGPEEYDYEKDKDLGTTVGFLHDKLMGHAQTSAFIESSNYVIKDGLLFHRKVLKNQFKKDALCLQNIETGHNVEFVAIVE